MKKIILLLLAVAAIARGAYLPQANEGAYAIRFTSAAISTGATGDLQTVATNTARYIVLSVYAETTAASGSLALATVDIRTATAGGGTSVLTAPVALASLTAVDLVQSLAPMALGAVQTAANLTLRQTVVSANAGTISVVVVILPVP